MADGDLTYGSYLDVPQSSADFSLPSTSSLNLTFNPVTGTPSFVPSVPSYADFQPTGGSPGAVSAPPAPVETTGYAQPVTPVAPAAAAPAATATPVAAATGSGAGNWLSTTAGNIGNWITNNPMQALGAVAGGAGLLSEMFGSSHDAEAQTMKQLGNQAGSAASTATMLQAPLTSGILPPGAQAAVNQAEQSGRAQVVSSYSRMGMGGSTGEADALRANTQEVQAMKFGIANSLFSQAAGYAKMASADYAQLLQFQMQQDQDFSNALSKFVSALAGGRSSGSSSTSPA